MSDRWFEDFKVGDQIVSSGKTLTEAEIIDWAFHFDPQPFHMDKVAAEEHMYGGLIASGWMLGTYAFRLFTMANPWAPEASLGSPGIEGLRLDPARASRRHHSCRRYNYRQPSIQKQTGPGRCGDGLAAA